MSQKNNTFWLEDELLVFPELINILVLSTGLLQMYNRIEIGHPIFKILFCNLAVTLASSLLNVVTYPINKTIRYSTLVNSNNAFCLMFHCSSWCILSVLRYIYIDHSNWLHKKFPDPSKVGILAIMAVFLTHFTSVGINISVAAMGGWPQRKIMEASFVIIVLRVLTLVGTFTAMIGVSCFFYIRILQHRGRLGKRQISPLEGKIISSREENGVDANQLHEGAEANDETLNPNDLLQARN
jgi:hypothetical protein